VNQVSGLQLQVELARGYATRAAMPAIKICRGEHKGCPAALYGGCYRQRDCPDCYVIAACDPRPTVEILRDMERGDG